MRETACCSARTTSSRGEPAGSAPEVMSSSTARRTRSALVDVDVAVATVESRVVTDSYFAKICDSSANALNSIALPAGSRKNIVHCSPGWPSKRR